MSTSMTAKEKQLADGFHKEYEKMQGIAKEYVQMLREKKIKESGEVSQRWMQSYNDLDGSEYAVAAGCCQ